jgi:hypothetical protein
MATLKKEKKNIMLSATENHNSRIIFLLFLRQWIWGGGEPEALQKKLAIPPAFTVWD